MPDDTWSGASRCCGPPRQDGRRSGGDASGSAIRAHLRRRRGAWRTPLAALTVVACASHIAAAGSWPESVEGPGGAAGLSAEGGAGACKLHRSEILHMHNADTFQFLPTAQELQESRAGECSRYLGRRLQDLRDHLQAVQSDEGAASVVYRIRGGGLGSVTSYAAYRFSHVLSAAFDDGRSRRGNAAVAEADGHHKLLFDWTGGLHKYMDQSLRRKFCPGLEDSLNCFFASPVKRRSSGGAEAIRNKDRRPAAPFIVPAKYADLGLFWYHANLLQFLLKPNQEMAAAISRVKSQLRWPPAGTPVLGLHIRRGDSCMDFYQSKIGNHHRECLGIKTYLHWAQHMKQQYGVRHVFVATDSPSFLDKVKAWHGFEVMSISMPRVETHRRAVWGFERHTGKDKERGSQHHHVTDAAQSAVMDLMLLSETDMFIGTMTSSLARNAYELMCARAGHLLPFISLDAAWCVSWGRDIPVLYHDGMGGSLARRAVLC